MRAKIAHYILSALFVSAIPSRTKPVRFLSIDKPILVQAQKNLPPNIAFQDLQFSKSQETQKDTKQQKQIILSTLDTRRTNHPIEKKVILEPISIQKKVEIIKTVEPEFDEEFLAGLSFHQRQRLLEAKTHYEQLDAEPPGQVQTERIFTNETTPSSDRTFAQQKTVADNNSAINLLGQIEVAGGLLFSNEHHFEIRRLIEGIAQERGTVDIKRGAYSIDLSGPQGMIVARLVNKNGRIIGEGSCRLSRLGLKQGSNQGPKILIEPNAEYSGVTSNVYDESRKTGKAPTNAAVTMFNGEVDEKVKPDGQIHFENVAKDSTSTVRVAAPGFLQTNVTAQVGAKFYAPLFPEKMIQALKDIVSDQHQYSIAKPSGPVIWGRVLMDGKPVSGVNVTVESDEEAIPVYFNEFLLPDLNLKSTSANGLYAILNISEGYQALLAERGGGYFSHANVITEENSVAVANLEATLQTESSTVRVFDAFSGEPVSAELLLQSVEATVNIGNSGREVVTLPQVSRQSLLVATPDSNYSEATYIYNDKDAYIRVPVVRSTWIENVRQYLKIEDMADSGLIVGFVNDENFEVYLAGENADQKYSIVYFNSSGQPLKNKTGSAGGGFIAFNISPGNHEVVVYGQQSEQIYSKAITTDIRQLTILNF